MMGFVFSFKGRLFRRHTASNGHLRSGILKEVVDRLQESCTMTGNLVNSEVSGRWKFGIVGSFEIITLKGNYFL